MRKRINYLALSLFLLLCFWFFGSTGAANAAETLNASPNAKIEYGYSANVQVGTIRYVQQYSTSLKNTTYVYDGYWNGNYSNSIGECYCASVSMALSYIGVNRTGGEILSGGRLHAQPGATVSYPSTVSAGVNNLINGNGKYSPVIIHWPVQTSSSFQHWVIVAGRVSGNTYLIVDPLRNSGLTTFQATIDDTAKTMTAGSKVYTIDSYMQYYNANAVFNHDPKGSVDLCVGGVGYVEIDGWAFDEDIPTETIQVHVYANPTETYKGTLDSNSILIGFVYVNKYRPDVDQAFSKYGIGSYHGYHEKLYPNLVGNYTISFYAVSNQPNSYNPMIGSFPITISADNEKPIISNIQKTNITSTGYRVSCTVTDNVGVTKVQFPTWTINNGKDDLIWHDAIKDGDTYYYDIKVSEHNNGINGYYTTHIYAWDLAQNEAGTATLDTYVDAIAPTVSNVQITNITSDGYRISCTVTDNIEVLKVAFPTWTLPSHQDDIIWHEAVKSGNTYYYDVKISEHNNENGCYYLTDVYAWDTSDNSVSIKDYLPTSDRIYVPTAKEFNCVHSNKKKNIDNSYLKSSATCDKSAVYYYECADCHKKLTDTFSYGKALGHKENTVKTPATVSKDGSIVKSCSRCKKELSKTKISRAYVKYDKKAVYTGKAIKLKIVDAKGKAISSSNYTITYKNNTKVGKATATVTFKNNYSGTNNYSFEIVPKATSIVSLKATTKALTVTWKKVSTDYTGYQIQYATSSNFKSGAKTVTVPSKTATSKQITGLKSGKNYYVRIRVYKTVKGKTYFSDWSDAKKVKVK